LSSNSENEDVSEEDDDEDYEEEMDDSGEDESVGNSSASGLKREYSPEEREAEAAAIGYKVVGPLERSDRVFKPYEAVFAVVQVRFRHFLCRF
jgi:large subunit ribosomal protein L21